MRKKFLITFILIILILFFSPKLCFGEEVAGKSANLIVFIAEKQSSQSTIFLKAKTIESILSEYHSPLINETQTFIKVCLEYEIDCYLLPAIAGVESSFGKFVYPNSYNPFGWGGGYIIFSSWKEAIETVGKGLKNNYLNQGINTIEKMGRIYAQSGDWVNKVQWFLKKFNQKEEEIRLLFLKNKVEF